MDVVVHVRNPISYAQLLTDGAQCGFRLLLQLGFLPPDPARLRRHLRTESVVRMSFILGLMGLPLCDWSNFSRRPNCVGRRGCGA